MTRDDLCASVFHTQNIPPRSFYRTAQARVDEISLKIEEG
jgi:hypothetical protein